MASTAQKTMAAAMVKAQAQLVAAKDRQKATRRERDTLIAAVHSMTKEIEKSKAEIEKNKAEIEKCDAEIEKYDAKKSTTGEDAQILSTRIADLNAAIHSLYEDNQCLGAITRRLSVPNEDLHKRIRECEATRAASWPPLMNA